MRACRVRSARRVARWNARFRCYLLDKRELVAELCEFLRLHGHTPSVTPALPKY
jgi:hypothetical protein